MKFFGYASIFLALACLIDLPKVKSEGRGILRVGDGSSSVDHTDTDGPKKRALSIVRTSKTHYNDGSLRTDGEELPKVQNVGSRRSLKKSGRANVRFDFPYCPCRVGLEADLCICKENCPILYTEFDFPGDDFERTCRNDSKKCDRKKDKLKRLKCKERQRKQKPGIPEECCCCEWACEAGGSKGPKGTKGTKGSRGRSYKGSKGKGYGGFGGDSCDWDCSTCGETLVGPTVSPTVGPTLVPTLSPTFFPTLDPTVDV